MLRRAGWDSIWLGYCSQASVSLPLKEPHVMEPAQSSETTMSERPYLTFRNASRRARGRGMARVAAAREELCKKRRATRVFATTVAGRRLAARHCSRGTAAQMPTASF